MQIASGCIKTYATEQAAKAGLKRAGLAQLPHTTEWYDARGSIGYTCRVTVTEPEDLREVFDRGFVAMLATGDNNGT